MTELRRRPRAVLATTGRPRRLHAVLAAVLLGAACHAPPGPVHLVESVRGAPAGAIAVATRRDPRPLRAGVACRELAIPPGYPLGGCARRGRRAAWPFLGGIGVLGRLALDARQRGHETRKGCESDMLEPALGTHDPLRAKALVLEHGDLRVALCRLDVLFATEELTARVWASVADLGIPRAGLVVAATHTHSGPGAYIRDPYSRAWATDNFRPEMLEQLVAATAGAIREAVASLQPARLGATSWQGTDAAGRPRFARSRRHPHDVSGPGEVDATFGLLRVDLTDRTPLAVVVNAAIHPMVLCWEGRLYSSDFVGPLEETLSAALPGAPEVLFVNGALGDALPAVGGPTHAEAERLGRRIATALRPVVAELPTGPVTGLGAARVERDMGRPRVYLTASDRRTFAAREASPWWWPVGRLLAAPVNIGLWTVGAWDLRSSIHLDLSAGSTLVLDDLFLSTTFAFHALRLGLADGPPGAALPTPRADARTSGPLDPGRELLLLTVPGEPNAAVGGALREVARASGAAQGWVVAVANGSLGYVTDPETFATTAYEAFATLWGPDTARLVLEASAAAAEATRLAVPGTAPPSHTAGRAP